MTQKEIELRQVIVKKINRMRDDLLVIADTLEQYGLTHIMAELAYIRDFFSIVHE